jgi:hypothetical protein
LSAILQEFTEGEGDVFHSAGFLSLAFLIVADGRPSGVGSSVVPSFKLVEVVSIWRVPGSSALSQSRTDWSS